MAPHRTRRFAWIPSVAFGVFFGASIGAYLALPATGLFLMVNMAGLVLVATAALVAALPVAVAGLLLARRSSGERARHGLRLVALRAFLAPLLVVAAAAESYAITRVWGHARAPLLLEEPPFDAVRQSSQTPLERQVARSEHLRGQSGPPKGSAPGVQPERFAVRRSRPVLLDVGFLIDFLRSPSWGWTSEALEELLGALALGGADTDQRAGRQEFTAESGLRCAVIRDRRSGEPTRVEFPFLVPSHPGVAPEVMVRQFLELGAVSVRAVLGTPSCEGREQLSGLRWDLGATVLALEADTSGDAVLLAVERVAEPEDAP